MRRGLGFCAVCCWANEKAWESRLGLRHPVPRVRHTFSLTITASSWRYPSICVGPASITGHSFLDDYGDVEDRISQTLGQFVQDCICESSNFFFTPIVSLISSLANKPSASAPTSTHVESADESAKYPEGHGDQEEPAHTSPSSPSPPSGPTATAPRIEDETGQTHANEGPDVVCCILYHF